MEEESKKKFLINHYIVIEDKPKRFGIIEDIYITPVNKIKYYKINWLSYSYYGKYISETFAQKYIKPITKEQYMAMAL